MRILMETITGRRGIKNFKTFKDFDQFMYENSRKIKKYAITDQQKEDINEWLQDLIKQSEQLYNYIAHVFFNLVNKHDDYNNLLAAAGKMIDVQTALKSCIKQELDYSLSNQSKTLICLIPLWSTFGIISLVSKYLGQLSLIDWRDFSSLSKVCESATE